MKISTDKPACWDRLAKTFNLDWNAGMIVTYGGVIYSKNPIAPDFLVHELVHVKQQEGHDPDEYLERYLSDVEFRKKSEVAAYKAQIAFIAQTEGDVNVRWNKLERLRQKLISNYGLGINYKEANELLKFR